MNMLITVLKPTESRASILGYDIIRQVSIVRRVIGVMPQECTADEDLTGHENIMLCADLYGISKDVAKRRAIELLELVELDTVQGQKGRNVLRWYVSKDNQRGKAYKVMPRNFS